MTVTLIVSGIVAPAFLWIGYFYYKDRFQPEPYLHMGLTYLMGLAAGYICFNSYALLPLLSLPEDPTFLMENHPFLFLLYCLGVVGILEEVLKFLPFILLVVRFKAFDEEIDGMIYASVIALGFASYENFHYLPLMNGFSQMGRAIASPLTHTIFASIWGHLVGTAIFFKRPRKKIRNAAIIGILLASLLHGLFDFFTLSPLLRILSAFVILGVWVWRIRLMEILHKKRTAEILRPHNSPNPGGAAPADTTDTVNTADTADTADTTKERQPDLKKTRTFFAKISFK